MVSVLRPDAVVRALQGAFCREAAPDDLLRVAAEHMHAAGPPYRSVRMFLGTDEAMTLVARVGEPSAPGRAPDLAVPISRHAKVLGRIEVDGDAPSRFDRTEAAAVQEIADALAVLL